MQDQEVINLYKKGESQYAIAKQFGVTHGKIQSILRRYKVPIRQGNQNKKYSCDNNYFSIIDSHEKAYWLGFITADGSVSKRDNEISIGLSYRDINHVEKFKIAIQSNNKIYVYNSTVNEKAHKCCKFCFHSSQMKQDLSTHNIIPNKSKTLEISKQVPAVFVNSYLLGIIDGDGSFFTDNEGQAHFSLIGSKPEIEAIQEILIKNCNVNSCKIQQETRSKQMWYLNYGGNATISRIVNYLYRDSTIYLQRKYDVISNLLGAYTKRKPGRQVDQGY